MLVGTVSVSLQADVYAGKDIPNIQITVEVIPSIDCPTSHFCSQSCGGAFLKSLCLLGVTEHTLL